MIRKMKVKAILWSLAAVAMLASCSKEDVSMPDNGEGSGEEATYAATVKLVLPSVKTPGSRVAEEPGFDDGNENEYKVDNTKVYFEFFDASYNRMNIVSGQQITWTTEGTTTDNITQVGAVTLKADRKPTYMVVFVNADEQVYGEINTLSLDVLKSPLAPMSGTDTRKAIAEHVANATNGFVMTNSSHYDGGGKRVQEVKVDDKIYKVGETAKDAVVVHVERIVAKATVDVTATKETGKDFYELTTENAASDGTSTTTTVTYGVKFLGWCLNATNRTMIPLKKIPDTKWTYSEEVLWNSAANGRSYWAEDGNYTDGKYLNNAGFTGKQVTDGEDKLALNYYSLNGIKNTLGATTSEYCFENTADASLYSQYGAVTHVLLKAQYVDADGNPATDNVYRLNKQIYTEQALKAWVVAQLGNTYPGVTFTTDEIDIVRNEMDYKDRNDVKGTVKYTGSAELSSLNKENLNSHLFGESTLWVYPQGYCYYSLPIKHFEVVGKSTTGYYGVVRNHWYQISVTAVNGFGHPADPDKPIVPEDIEDNEWQLQCKINVLAWAKKTQNATVGGDDIWN